MELGFSATKAVIGQVFRGVGDNVIHARMKTFQRENFPSEAVRVGTGWRAAYSHDDLWRLLIAFALLDAGMSPSTTMDVFAANDWEPIKVGIDRAWEVRHSGASERRPVLIVAPRALVEKRSSARTEVVELGELQSLFERKEPYVPNIVIVDLARIARRFERARESVGSLSKSS